MTAIFIDADACPVKSETYKVAKRYGLSVWVVANSWLQVPASEWIEMVLVPGGADVADDWIAEHATMGDIVVTADIPLAGRSVKKGAQVLTPRGRVLDEDSVADAVATRNLMENLREIGDVGGGPPPFAPKDRSKFLSKLDELVHRIRRSQKR